VSLNTGDRAQQLDDLGVRSEHRLDLLVQRCDRGVERVDVRKQLRDQDPVVLDPKPVGERLSQLRDLRASSPSGAPPAGRDR
jgi:hypothetical protein